jgi:hypothetical protein
MFRRSLVVTALTIAAVPFVTVPAGAAAHVDEAFHGAFAEGQWRTSSTSFGNTLVSREQNGTTHLSVRQFDNATFDGDGNLTSGTEITGETIANVSFSIDTVHFTQASVSGMIPVSRCTIVDGQETGCVDAGSVHLSAAWTGIGPIPHLPDTELSWDDCHQVDRNSSVEREATLVVDLALNGGSIAASQDGFAGFGKGISRLIVACPAR